MLLEVIPMNKTIEAIYENGVFRPVEPVRLPEGERVRVTLPDLPDEIQRKLKALKELDAAFSDMTEEEWKTLDDAVKRRPWFGGREIDL
jgi:predicted DNA-binding antitoxin AbrB/MazE fold protein